jgi:hypothetical protein
MCGRYRRTTREEELARIHHIPIPAQPDLPISYNIAPSQPVLAIQLNLETKQRSLDTLIWGLVPYWSKDGNTGSINARAERIDVAPAFRRLGQNVRNSPSFQRSITHGHHVIELHAWQSPETCTFAAFIYEKGQEQLLRHITGDQRKRSDPSSDGVVREKLTVADSFCVAPCERGTRNRRSSALPHSRGAPQELERPRQIQRSRRPRHRRPSRPTRRLDVGVRRATADRTAL